MPGPLPPILASKTVAARLRRRPLEAEDSLVIAVVGSSGHLRRELVVNSLEGIPGFDGTPAWGAIGTVWLTGNLEKGVDAWVREWALENECTLKVLWTEQEVESNYSEHAPKRSDELVEQADLVVVMTWGRPTHDEARIANLAVKMGRSLILLVHDENSKDDINWPM